MARTITAPCTPFRSSPRIARRNTVSVKALASPWQTLGVAPGSDPCHIKRAYRKLALKLHPDVNQAPDASERFMEVQSAYDQLCKADEAQAWEPSPNHGQRGCRATWERQVAGTCLLRMLTCVINLSQGCTSGHVPRGSVGWPGTLRHSLLGCSVGVAQRGGLENSVLSIV